MTEAMPFLQKYDITFLRPPAIAGAPFSLNFPQHLFTAGAFHHLLDVLYWIH